MNAGSVLASTACWGSRFHSLMVLGRKDWCLYAALPNVTLSSCFECPLLSLALGGLSCLLMWGPLARSCWNLKSMPNLAALLLSLRVGHSRVVIMSVTLEVL